MWNRGHFDRKAQAALALAVSLWIAGGGVVVAGQITTVETDYTGELNGNHSGDNWGDRTGDPNDNEVTVNAAVKVTGDVRGGYYFNKDGKVTNNIVTINGTVTKAVYGGESGRGYDVMGNQVTVTGTVGENVYGGRVRGGDGTATGNTVTVNGGTINMNVYGGYSFRGDAEKNTVTIEGGEVEHVYGGNSTGGDVLENEVYIQGGTVKHNVYGGFANENEKKAEANEVTISGGEVSGHVYGGHSDSGQATNNKVTISGGVVRGQVYGGETFGSMENATGNEVTINSGTVLLDVYGGDALFGGAAHNHVIIKGKVSGRVYGGRSSNPSDGGWNKVEILGGTVDSDVYGDFKNSCNNTVVLHDATVGGSVCGDAELHDDTGNTLILSGSSTVNDSVNNFETIEFDGEKFSWDTTKTVLTANQFSNPDCTLDVTALVNKTGTGTMTLLSSERENDFETLKLAYNTATQATPVTLDSSKTSQVVKAGTTKTSEDKGIIIAYNENEHTVSLDAANNYKNVNYTIANNVNKITLGTITWSKDGTARELPAGNYTFNDSATIDTSSFEFNTPSYIGAGDSMTLISNATGLTAGDSIAHSQSYTNYDNCIKLNATLTGSITRTADTLGYTAIGTTLDSVDLANWNGTTTAVPAGWTSNLGENSIKAAGFTAPTINAGESKDILTTNTANFFSDDKITGAMKYAEQASSSDTDKGVTLTGSESKGVKASADGKNLVYARSKFDISKTAFGEMTWGVSRDESSEGYNYSSAAIDASGLKFTNWNPEDGVADSSTILLLTNDTLPDFTAIDKSYSYSVVPNSGVTVDSIVSGSISKSENNIVYTVKENKATKLNFDKVNWLNTSALIDHATTLSNVTFSGADVDTTNIKFTNLQTAASDDKMILVSSFGSTIGTVTGTEFSVGKGKGKGNAYLEGNDLKYVVTQGVAFNSTGDNNAIDAAGDPVSGEVTSDVIGGVAQNDGIAKENKMEVQAGSNVTGNVTAATSQHGSSLDNEAKITDASVSGNVTGAMTENGTAADNKATVENTTVNVDVIGAKTVSGLATGNIANVTGGKVEGNVIGAQSTSGTVSTGNKANVSGAEIGGNVCGGISKDGESNANKTELSNGAKVSGNVYGGMSEEKTATANSVTIKNATVDGDVYGAKSKEVSRNNEVKFNGGKVKNLIGGGCETAVGNTVTVENGTVEESVYGGKADVDAQNNCVILSGGKVTDTVYGGWSASINGKTQGNSVLLYGTADVSSANIAGGNLEATRNTLTIGLSTGNINTSWTGGEQGVKNISNFENITFAVVPWSESKAALTITDGTASDLSMSKIDAKKVHFTDVDALKKDDAMTLLDQSKAANKATSIEEKSEFTAGTTIKGKGSLSLDDNNNVRFTVNEMGVSEQSHNTVMGAEVSMVALGAGDDFIAAAEDGLGHASNVGADGIASFATMGGGSIRQETGSHVDTRTWNAIIALGHKNEKEKCSFEYGAFFEYGRGNYTTYNGDQRGDGSTYYTGGGLLAKWQKKDGIYVEGSLRAGNVHDDAKNVLRDAMGNPYSYETDAPYWGVHVGVGKVIQLNESSELDVYGKFFHNHRNSVSFDAGGHYDLDAVNSDVLRLGTRYVMKREKWNFYGGLAYEQEFSGKAEGTADGMAIRGADTSGGSLRAELGAVLNPKKDGPITLDFNLSGFAGKKRGLTGGVAVTFNF